MSANIAGIGVEQRSGIQPRFGNFLESARENLGQGVELLRDKASNAANAVVNLAGVTVEKVKKPMAVAASVIALAGGVATAESGVVETAFGSSGPGIEKTTGQDNNVATESSLKKECIDTALAKPDSVNFRMHNPGVFERQSILLDAFYKPLDPACGQYGNRASQYKIQFEDVAHKVPGMWVGQDGRWHSMFVRNIGGKGGFFQTPTGHEPKNSNFYLKRTPGNSETDGRVLLRERFIGKKEIRIPVKGYPGLYQTRHPILGQSTKVYPLTIFGNH